MCMINAYESLCGCGCAVALILVSILFVHVGRMSLCVHVCGVWTFLCLSHIYKVCESVVCMCWVSVGGVHIGGLVL